MRTRRLRSMRRSAEIRDRAAETRLDVKDLILPYFVVEGRGIKSPIKAMPGVSHLSVDNLLKDIESSRDAGIRAVLMFGVSRRKDKDGSYAYKSDGLIQTAVAAARKRFNDLTIMTDVCLCGYTSHGHCGIVRKRQGFLVDNGATVKILARIAVSHAAAGADFVAPSAMMDRQVRAIRRAMDANGFKGTKIMGYSAKYASNFYWPFREALGSMPKFGDRKSYQMDFRNSDEALREIEQDIDEGADIVMVKPALSYLDIIARAKQKFDVPMAAYNVSGEYSLVKNLDRRAGADEKDLALEMLVSMKRAGADFIITYWAREAAAWLKNS